MQKLKKAKSIEVLENLKINVIFQDGEEKTLDITPYCTGKAFKCFLKDEGLFKTAHLDKLGGIEWNNGASLSPETVFIQSK